MRKPIIGIMPLIDTDKKSYWMLPGYMNGITLSGGLPLMLPLTSDEETLSQIAHECDGFLFTGGQDVSPALYGEVPSKTCGECCSLRDEMEQKLLPIILELDKPTLGICRGIQILNALLGGTLYQDLPSEKPSSVEHHQAPPYDVPIHKVEILEHTPLFELIPSKNVSVNSYHHQAVKDLAPCLKPMAYSEDHLVEAVWMPGKKYVWAVQWHPELSYYKDENSRKIFQQFLQAIKW